MNVTFSTYKYFLHVNETIYSIRGWAFLCSLHGKPKLLMDERSMTLNIRMYNLWVYRTQYNVRIISSLNVLKINITKLVKKSSNNTVK